eukprot:132807-Pyramimonas_sp.AAC.1
MSHRLEVTVAREPPVVSPTNVKRTETIIKAKAKAKMICRSFKETDHGWSSVTMAPHWRLSRQ